MADEKPFQKSPLQTKKIQLSKNKAYKTDLPILLH